MGLKRKTDPAKAAPESADEAKIALAELEKGQSIVLAEGNPEPGDEGEWFTPQVGDVFDNVQIERVFFVTGDKDPRPAYALRELEGEAMEAGKLWLLSEKADMKKLRVLNLGARISMEFTGQVGARGKWTIRIVALQNGPGRNILKELVLEHKKMAAGLFRDFRMPQESEEVPF